MCDKEEGTEDNKMGKICERDVWLEFVDTCSICGLCHCTAQNKTRARLWIVVVVAAFICFGIHFYLMLSNYLDYPLNRDVSVHTTGFQFPDVTLCIKHPFSNKHLTKGELGVHNASRFWQYYMLQSGKGYKSLNEEELKTVADYYAMLSFRKYADEPEGYIDIVGRISRCKYKGRKCKPHYFSEAKLPERLNCVTFHPDDRHITDLGPDSALHLTLDTGDGFEVTDSINELYLSNGYEVTIHENGTEPNFKKQLFLTQSGREHDISMSMSKYQKLATPKKPCLDEIITDVWAVNMHAPPIDRMAYRRTRDTCKMLEFQRSSIEKCGCWRDDHLIPFSESFGKGKPLCHELPEAVFYNENLDFETGKITYHGTEIDVSPSSAIFQDIQSRFKCYAKFKATAAYNNLEHCIHNCESISYDANMAVSDYKFNIDNYLKLYESIFRKFKMRDDPNEKTDLEKLRKELGNGDKVLTIKVYPVDLDVMLTEESLAYDLISFFSDFGGNIGLWIGCTVVTLAEVIELFVRLGYVKIKRMRQRNQPNDKKSDGEKGKEDSEAINLTTAT